jgi:hypothetical protein
MNKLENLPRPRCLKAHLPVPLLPDDVWIKKPKIVYVSRDARDVAISNYHLVKHFGDFTLNSFLEDFLNDHFPYSLS